MTVRCWRCFVDPFLLKQLFLCASHGILQYVLFGLRRIHLSHEAQRTRYGSKAAM